MSLNSEEQQLLRISKAPAKLLTNFRDGVYITSATSRSLDDLRDQACADRLDMAKALLHVGDKLMRSRPAEYRSSISRYYYAMYHSMRATAFYVHDGDDHQKHEALPQHTPPDFPDAAVWENRLKDARARRNDADYDPYPLAPVGFQQTALELQHQARLLIPIVQNYLRQKGCAHV